MAGNCYCFRCKQPLIEIEEDGRALKGCLNCNVWWAMRGDTPPRLSEPDLRALNKKNDNRTRLRSWPPSAA